MKASRFSLFTILFVAFIDWMGIGLVYPLFASMIFSHEIMLLPADASSETRSIMLGILLAMAPLMQFLSSPLIGTISDQKGRKFVLNRCLILVLLGYLVAFIGVITESLFFLIISRIMVGIASGSGAACGAAIADISDGSNKTKNFGLLSMAFGFGFMAGPFLGGALSEVSIGGLSGFATPFLFAALAALANLVMVMVSLEETSGHVLEGAFDFTESIKKVIEGFMMPSLRGVLLCIFLFCFGWSFYWEFIPSTWIQLHGFTTAKVGGVYAFGAGFYAVCSGFLIRPIAHRFSAFAIMFYSLVCGGISILVMLWNHDPDWVWLYIPAQQMFLALLYPAASTVVSDSVDAATQGKALGIMHSVDCFAFAVSPLVAGSVLAMNFHLPIIVGGTCMLAASVVLWVYSKDKILAYRQV